MRIRQRGIGQIISQKRRGMLGCQRRPVKEASINKNKSTKTIMIMTVHWRPVAAAPLPRPDPRVPPPPQIAQEEEFLMLNPSQLIKLIHRDELNVFDERDVYKAVLQWVMHDEKTRRPKLECIMKSVRCELLPARYLKDQLENQPLLQGPDTCREYLSRLLKGGSSAAAERGCGLWRGCR